MSENPAVTRSDSEIEFLRDLNEQLTGTSSSSFLGSGGSVAGGGGNDPGPVFFTTSAGAADVDVGFTIDVGSSFSGGAAVAAGANDSQVIDTERLLQEAALLVSEDEEESEEGDDDEDEEFMPKTRPPSAFQFRVQAGGVSIPAGPVPGKRRRGRPSKAEMAARIAANGGVPPPPAAKKTPRSKAAGGGKIRSVLSDKAKSLRRKVSSSTWGKVHRERRNASVDDMKNVLPGVSTKLDTAGVMELSVQYILFLKKRVPQGTDDGFLKSCVTPHRTSSSTVTSSTAAAAAASNAAATAVQ